LHGAAGLQAGIAGNRRPLEGQLLPIAAAEPDPTAVVGGSTVVRDRRPLDGQVVGVVARRVHPAAIVGGVVEDRRPLDARLTTGEDSTAVAHDVVAGDRGVADYGRGAVRPDAAPEAIAVGNGVVADGRAIDRQGAVVDA